jgi:tripartite-type tricarboxylate transporter receptor subunit TctC
VARGAPDGTTLLVTPGGHAIFGAIFKSLPFDTVNSFEWISNIATIPFFLVVPAKSEFLSLADLIAKAKTNPGTVTFGSAGPGSTHHLGIELLANGPEPSSCTSPIAAMRQLWEPCLPVKFSSAWRHRRSSPDICGPAPCARSR